MNLDTFRLVREELAEGSKGTKYPLELLQGHLLEGPFHRSLQKTGLQKE